MELDDVLTGQEQQASYTARLDLGAGYPQLAVPEFVRVLYADPKLGEASLAMTPDWTPRRQADVDVRLRASVLQFLNVDERTAADLVVSPTFSGGTGLDRAITAAVRLCEEDGAPHTHVVACTPSIDVMRFLLEERGSSVQAHFVENKYPYLGALDADRVIDMIAELRRASHAAGIVIILTSPENPTGEMWTREALEALTQTAIECRAVLVVDHAYLTAGVHQRQEVCAIWEIAPGECNWIGVWDTGKTFGLNEDKLGFVISGNERVESCLSFALSTLQFGVARRQKILFAQILSAAPGAEYVSDLREVCRENLRSATSLAANSPLLPATIRGGSVLLIELADPRWSDERVRRGLLAQGVGVVAGRVFFHTAWRPRNFIRVALAREPEYFRRAFRAVVDFASTSPSLQARL